jgi:hypothetical protein
MKSVKLAGGELSHRVAHGEQNQLGPTATLPQTRVHPLRFKRNILL